MTDVTGEAAAHARTAPALRVVHGDPAPEEIAALVTVLAAAAAGASTAGEPATSSTWAGRARGARGHLAHGPGAWRASALPA